MLWEERGGDLQKNMACIWEFFTHKPQKRGILASASSVGYFVELEQCDGDSK